jgi:hypothetical protein
MKYGYARVSKDEQNPAMQLAALEKARCHQTFTDEGISGAVAKPCALSRCSHDYLQPTFLHQVQQLEGGAGRPLLADLPLLHR